MRRCACRPPHSPRSIAGAQRRRLDAEARPLAGFHDLDTQPGHQQFRRRRPAERADFVQQASVAEHVRIRPDRLRSHCLRHPLYVSAKVQTADRALHQGDRHLGRSRCPATCSTPAPQVCCRRPIRPPAPFDLSVSAARALGRQIELRLLYGTSFKIFGHNGFADIAAGAALDRQPTAQRNAVRSHGSASGSTKDSMLMAQSFNIVSADDAAPALRRLPQPQAGAVRGQQAVAPLVDAGRHVLFAGRPERPRREGRQRQPVDAGLRGCSIRLVFSRPRR